MDANERLSNLNNKFSDRLHVEAIRQALWRGRASVMVGAGFSRNAEPSMSGQGPLPLWRNLINNIWNELGRTGSCNTKPGFGDDPLRLAEEYQQIRGRTELDNLIERYTPDHLYMPGSIFEEFLALPWQDVFTTNYDRLLERAAEKIPERTYDLVLTPADLSTKNSPRIIKLHGSFPSHRPYVFTLEDYRRYPREKAPFINLVQQAIMENVFCLVGFSGDDPNFLQWVGWVRDCLGTAAPPIYLCGLFSFSSSQQRFFQSLGITPVDLGALFPHELYPGGKRHRYAMEWLIRSFQNGRPQEWRCWPTLPNLPRRPPLSYDHGPQPLEVPKCTSLVMPPQVSSKEVTIEELRHLERSWKSERLAYPGWVLLPEQHRAKLSFGVEQWLYQKKRTERVAVLIDQLSLLERLDLLFEFVWRIQTLLLPLPDWIVSRIESTLVSINVDPSSQPNQQTVLSRGDILPAGYLGGNGLGAVWDELTDKWISLAFVLINDCWQSGTAEKSSLWQERLTPLVRDNSEYQSKLYSAKCWHHLLNLDAISLISELQRWPDNTSQPLWQAKKASFLWFLGERHRARQILAVALNQARQNIGIEWGSYRRRSELGWILYAAGLFHHNSFMEFIMNEPQFSCTEHNIQNEEFESQLDSLIHVLCDPRIDIEKRERNITAKQPGIINSKDIDFDPEVTHYKTEIKSGSATSEWLLLQTYHDMPTLLILDEQVGPAVLTRVWSQNPKLAASLAILCGEPKLVDALFSRLNIATVTLETIKSLHTWLLITIRESLAQIMKTGADFEDWSLLHYKKVLKFGLDVLSRLISRLDCDLLDATLRLAISVYDDLPKLKNSALIYDTLGTLFKRLISCSTGTMRLQWLPSFLTLRIPGQPGFLPDNSETHRYWWDPFSKFDHQLDELPTPSKQIRIACNKEVEPLLYQLENGTPSNRSSFVRRLGMLSLLGILSKAYRNRFCQLLWSRCDSSGIPSGTTYYAWGLLRLPEPTPGAMKQAVSSYLVDSPIPRTGQTISFDRAYEYFWQLICITEKPWKDTAGVSALLDWNYEQTLSILDRLLDWWAAERAVITRCYGAGDRWGDDCRKALEFSAITLAEVIMPRLCIKIEKPKTPQQRLRHGGLHLKAEIQRKISSFIEEMRMAAVAPIALSIVSLLLKCSTLTSVALQLREKLYSAQSEDVEEAVRAIRIWYTLSLYNFPETLPLPENLLDELILLAVSRRWPGLVAVLHSLAHLVVTSPSLFELAQLERLNLALNYIEKDTDFADSEHCKDALPISPNQRLLVRVATAQLAANLYRFHQERGGPIPDSVQRWHASGTAPDALPELRRPWVRSKTATAAVRREVPPTRSE